MKMDLKKVSMVEFKLPLSGETITANYWHTGCFLRENGSFRKELEGEPK
jgi:hypothetical protein